MKLSELAEDQKVYVVKLSNKDFFVISGLEKVSLMKSAGQFIELRTGEIFNKAHIVSIKLDKEATRDNYLKLGNSLEKLS